MTVPPPPPERLPDGGTPHEHTTENTTENTTAYGTAAGTTAPPRNDASSSRGTSGVTTFLRVLGWFAFLCGLGLAAITAIMAIALLGTGDSLAVALVATLSASFIFGGLAVLLLCYTKFWQALGAFAFAVVLGVATVGLGMVFENVHDPELSSDAAQNLYFTPVEPAGLQTDYYLDVGELTLDLSQLKQLPEPRTVNAEVRTGRLSVILPREVPVDLECTLSLGETHRCTAANIDTAGETLTLQLKVGIGEIMVHEAYPESPENTAVVPSTVVSSTAVSTTSSAPATSAVPAS